MTFGQELVVLHTTPYVFGKVLVHAVVRRFKRTTFSTDTLVPDNSAIGIIFRRVIKWKMDKFKKYKHPQWMN